MGWLWASSASAPKPDPATPASCPSQPPSTAQPAAPNEPVDPEIQKFFDLLRHDDLSSSSHPNSTPSAAAGSNQQGEDGPSSRPSVFSWLALKAAPKPSSPRDAPPAPLGDALAESLLPTEMSCRQAFDLAWSCNSLGGQFNSVYRYGEMRSCSEHWDDFWFCMRTKSYTGELKESMIRAHYREKEHRKYGAGKPSSEDIWESRSERVPPGSAFAEKVELPALSDELRRAESGPRRAAGQELGQD